MKAAARATPDTLALGSSVAAISCSSSAALQRPRLNRRGDSNGNLRREIIPMNRHLTHTLSTFVRRPPRTGEILAVLGIGQTFVGAAGYRPHRHSSFIRSQPDSGLPSEKVA